MQRLQQQGEEPAGSCADQHCAAPSQRLGQGWAKPATEQDACRDRSLRHRECERRISADRPPAKQLGTAGVASAAIQFPTSADSTKPAAPPMIATAISPPVESSAIWLMRMAPWRMMNPPDPSWPINAAMAVRAK